MNRPLSAPTVDTWIQSCRSEGASALDVVAAYARALAGHVWPQVGFDDAPALFHDGSVTELLRTLPPLRFATDSDLLDDAAKHAPEAMGLDDGLTGTPADLGVVYERALAREHRHEQGIYYTPIEVASQLAELALDHHVTWSGRGLQQQPPTICDPAMGGGAFLLAAAQRLYEAGVEPSLVVKELVWGIDIDPQAVIVAEAALALWAWGYTNTWVSPGRHLVCSDALVTGMAAFETSELDRDASTGFDVVIGNPPFQGQLGADTARDPDSGKVLRERWGVATGAYADTAAYFLLVADELTAGQGTTLLLQPHSTLATEDSAAIRTRLESKLAGLWLSQSQHFVAAVEVCAPLLSSGANAGAVEVWLEHSRLEPFRHRPGDSWATALAHAMGTPAIDLPSERQLDTVGLIATATAGFRDQFYGLAPATKEATVKPGPEHDRAKGQILPLVTVGMVDPLHNRWGHGEFRFAKRKWRMPIVDAAVLASDDPAMLAWVTDRLSPKLVVATQTKILEVIVDIAGTLVPSTPAIAVHAHPDELWKLAAALTSPVLSALALSRAAGGALTADAIKLSARQLLELPLPTNDQEWAHGAALAEAATTAADAGDAGTWRAKLEELGLVMCAAYGVDPQQQRLLDWWTERLPPWR